MIECQSYFKNNEKLSRLVMSVLLLPLLLRANCPVRQEEEQGPSISYLVIASSKKTSGAKCKSIGNFIQTSALLTGCSRLNLFVNHYLVVYDHYLLI